MGSSVDEPKDNGGIDPSVGGLVWVRRRNGSWWPGRIVALDEITESCLASPKLGTPVKLLGREDASVDWYNLEKSRRVKAFRCGEYDACIEKAKASAANPNRKAVKYARREDAIIHALELESALQGKDHQYVSSKMENLIGEQSSSAQESPTLSQSGEDDDLINEESDSDEDSGSMQELSQSGISFEDPNHISASKVQSGQGKRRKTPNDSEDDGTEVIKRMKGLEDLGICVGSKRKLSGGDAVELVKHDCSPLYDSHTGNGMSNGTSVNGTKGYNSLKGKRSQVANVHELRRKNRRRPLTKVLESTAMLPIPVTCDELPSSNGSSLCGLPDARVSGMESNESRKSISLVINSNSDSTGVSCETSLHASENVCDASLINNKTKENEISSISVFATNDTDDRLFDVPFVGEEKHSADFSPGVGALARQSSLSSQAEAVSLKNEGLNESVSTSLVTVLVDDLCQSLEKGTMWLLKGKRNTRKLSKDRIQDSRKYVGMDDASNAYLAGMEYLDDGLQLGSVQKVDCDGTGGFETLYNCSLSEPVFEDVFWGWNRSSHLQPSMRGSREETKVFPLGSMSPQRSLPFWQSHFMVHPKYRMPDIPVKSFFPDSKLYDVEIEVKANYRPQHVSLVSVVSKIDGKAIVGHPLTVEVLDDGYCDHMMSGIEYDATDLAPSKVKKTSYSVKRNFEAGRKSAKDMSGKRPSAQSKSSKVKKGVLMSKKIRKLSSLSGQISEEEEKPVLAKLRDAVITCIPLKLVFSRINEAVNGSARPTRRALTHGNS